MDDNEMKPDKTQNFGLEIHMFSRSRQMQMHTCMVPVK